jgi:hypothetical protein
MQEEFFSALPEKRAKAPETGQKCAKWPMAMTLE